MLPQSMPAAVTSASKASSDDGHRCSTHTSSLRPHSCMHEEPCSATLQVTLNMPIGNGNVLVRVVVDAVVIPDVEVVEELDVVTVVLVEDLVDVVKVTGTLERHGQNRRVLEELLP